MLAGLSYSIAALIVGIVIWIAASGDAGEPTFTGQTPGVAELERLHDIRDRMASVRALDVASAISEEYLSRDDLTEYIDRSYGSISDADRREIESSTLVLRLLRMIGPEDDLLSIFADSSSLGIAGFYSYDDKRLVVVTEQLDGSVIEESTLAHEYTHALQDKQFELDKFLEIQEDASATEYGTTLSCVVEGDASLFEVRYLIDHYGDDWATLLIAEYRADTELQELQVEYAAAVPGAIRRYTSFNYSECAAFVGAVWDEGGWEAVDQLYEKPPSTTEQVLHPSRYFRRRGSCRAPSA